MLRTGFAEIVYMNARPVAWQTSSRRQSLPFRGVVQRNKLPKSVKK